MFYIDERLQSTCYSLGDWPLSRVLLKNEACYPWFILVPRKENIQEIHQLETNDRLMLMEEINQLSCLVKHYFKPEKLNIGALGNMVPQLHLHVVGRSKKDPLWPHSVWQPSFSPAPYKEDQLKTLISVLCDLVEDLGKIWG